MAELRARLTGPGGEFELAEQDVRGTRLPVFVHRRAALRDWLVDSAAYGEREYLVQGERRLTFAAHLDAVGGAGRRPRRRVRRAAGRPRRDPGRELARLGGGLLGRRGALGASPSPATRGGRRARRRTRSSACGRGSSSPTPSGRALLAGVGRAGAATSPTCPPSSPRAGRSRCRTSPPRRGRPRGDHVHQRHDRASQGRGALARATCSR